MNAAAPAAAGSGANSAERPLRLMIVDDSPVARGVLSRMLAPHGDLTVVAMAGAASEALDLLGTTSVDVVLLDVEMPGTSGLDALPDILRAGPRVLIVSSSCERIAGAMVQGLEIGAADVLPKPGAQNPSGRFSDLLAHRIRRLGRGGQTELPSEACGAPDPAPLRRLPKGPVSCIAIGASTGGLGAIAALLRALPHNGAPILVSQHLPHVFMPFFIRQIENASGRVVRLAEAGLVPAADEVIVARGDAHLCLVRSGSTVHVQLGRAPSASGCMPSVDTMLASAASIYGPELVGIVLSGMGRDGLDGARRVVEAGGAMLVQDRASSAVWGMPRAIAEAGLASAILPPASLAAAVPARAELAPCR